MFWRYVGKLRPGQVHDDPKAPEPEVSNRWKFDGRMTWAAALRILGFGSRPTTDELRTRYRTLMHQHHPDKGGDTGIAAAIIAAYGYVKTA